MLSRRSLLQGVAAAVPLGAGPLPAVAAAPPVLAFVGGYAPNAAGIQTLAQQGARLRSLHQSANPHNPSWLVVAPSGRYLYAVNEHEDFQGRRSGSVSSYAIADGGALRLLSTVPSGGAGPVHLSLHPGGRHAFVAHYGSGHVALLPVLEDGALGAPAQVLPPPAGRAPHAHMALPDASGRFLLATDLGLDLITVWRFDAQRGRLAEAHTQVLPAGSGPRHLAFHPRLPRQLYLLSEQASSLAWFDFDPASGRLAERARLSSLPAGFAGTSYASDLRFSRDGRHLYALNRLHDSIAIYAIGADGRPRWQGQEWTRGSYPRSCALDPAGEHLYVCNQRSDHITVFRIGADGALSFSGDYLAAGSPAVIAFMPASLS